MVIFIVAMIDSPGSLQSLHAAKNVKYLQSTQRLRASTGKGWKWFDPQLLLGNMRHDQALADAATPNSALQDLTQQTEDELQVLFLLRMDRTTKIRRWHRFLTGTETTFINGRPHRRPPTKDLSLPPADATPPPPPTLAD